MAKDSNIERVHKIDGVKVSTPIDLSSDIAEKKVKGENKGISYYAVPKESRLERVFDWVLDTVAGKNKAGKGLGQFKNLVTWIFPQTEPIDWITDEIGDKIKSQRTQKINNMNWIQDRLSEKSTWRGIIVASTAAFGFSIAPELQEAIITAGVALFTLVEVAFSDDGKENK